MEKVIKWVSGLLLIAIIILVSLVAPIDYTPIDQQPYYHRMMAKLDTFNITTHAPTEKLKVGWSQFSIIPDYPVPMAGYRPRDKFSEIHDSLFIRILAISNGPVTAYLITADLLLFPSALKNLIIEKLGPQFSDFIYFSATHSHTSVGGWDPTLLGRILMGDYEEKWIDEVADNTAKQMIMAKSSMKPADLHYWEVDVRNYIANRIELFAEVDGKLRGLQFHRVDNSKGLLFILGAHTTMIGKRFTSLSGDYPSEIMKGLSKDYSYSQFMAGTVGSQRFRGFKGQYDFELTESVGKLFSAFINEAPRHPMTNAVVIKTGKIEIEHGPSQLRLTANFKLRDWVFRFISRPLQGEINVLQIGNVLMLGTSNDFSGEIAKVNEFEKYSSEQGIKLIITSFNGEYTGYVTEDSHYQTKADEELRILNWVGPHFGQYYSEIIKRIIDKVGE